MLLLLDNYDSFTYNLAQYFAELRQSVKVIRANKLSLTELLDLKPTHLVISPGPGTPAQAKQARACVKAFAGRVPILGICLGHQCIAEVYGATVSRAPKIMHGKTSVIRHQAKGLFTRCPQPMRVTRYHSLAVDAKTLPDCLVPTAWTDDDNQQTVMALEHKTLPIFGVQFHPESVLSESGHLLLANFLMNALV